MCHGVLERVVKVGEAMRVVLLRVRLCGVELLLLGMGAEWVVVAPVRHGVLETRGQALEREVVCPRGFQVAIS